MKFFFDTNNLYIFIGILCIVESLAWTIVIEFTHYQHSFSIWLSLFFSSAFLKLKNPKTFKWLKNVRKKSYERHWWTMMTFHLHITLGHKWGLSYWSDTIEMVCGRPVRERTFVGNCGWFDSLIWFGQLQFGHVRSVRPKGKQSFNE